MCVHDMDFLEKKMKMVAKGISGEWGWETIQHIISDEDHDCFGRFSNTFASEGSPIFLPTRSVVYFQ